MAYILSLSKMYKVGAEMRPWRMAHANTLMRMFANTRTIPTSSGVYQLSTLRSISYTRAYTTTPFDTTSGSFINTADKTDYNTEEALSVQVEQYWRNVNKYLDNDDGSYLAESRAKGTMNPENIKDLINKAVKIKRSLTSDILPNIVTTNLMESYRRHGDDVKQRFFEVLYQDFDVDERELEAAMGNLQKELRSGQEHIAHAKAMMRLRLASEPVYNSLFTQIARHAGGIKCVIDMRADLLRIKRKTEDQNAKAAFKCLDDCLMRMLMEWFNIGFLDLRQITWNSPAAWLEQVYKNEQVHKVSDWQDLKRRVGEDRMVFGFFHRSLPDTPLVIVHVALTSALSSSVQALLGPEAKLDTAKVHAANFYSINSTQKGLSGADLGNFLIKRVSVVLKHRFPNLEIASTLSPVPGFRSWLETQFKLSATSTSADNLLKPDEAERISSAKPGHTTPTAALKAALSDDQWSGDLAPVTKPILLRLCARYLVLERNRKFALDPVANFHIRNGASVYRLNWLGDTSDRGMQRSYGIMVNYRYEEEKVEVNNARYLMDAHISVSEEIQKLLD
ncbi:hypothetical protein SARC_01147 [Sphaeroforma arctica JP610]|uniref:Malonyl-CoA decarboxylase n=1 Tax=Sphaeroforma arctica JP610 TaxID=667725 RepID=A0A0L0GCJ0_9EUKA|nr:hypothetical protein SARC_01147 [Sphaeroforma arctica JP610]KNC86727.1 hypothetical protein SARC_01147 [Sphaeroforma arctica JP610]|eukprot:XP_014160629.1 hypothetical protein SARC_01147 [Sphaeroforma arctica JP610]